MMQNLKKLLIDHMITEKQKVAQDILEIIKTYAYSKDPEYIEFRVNNGSKGVIDAIIQYIIDTYL